MTYIIGKKKLQIRSNELYSFCQLLHYEISVKCHIVKFLSAINYLSYSQFEIFIDIGPSKNVKTDSTVNWCFLKLELSIFCVFSE